MEYNNNRLYLFRRIVETALIEFVSSVLVYILILNGFIPSTQLGYICCFGASALIFFILNYFVLYAHFWRLEFNIPRYFIINFTFFGCMATASAIGTKLLPNNIYTALFGYTKPFRQLIGLSPLKSAALFWGIYFILIIFVVMKVLFLDSDYKALIQAAAEAAEAENVLQGNEILLKAQEELDFIFEEDYEDDYDSSEEIVFMED